MTQVTGTITKVVPGEPVHNDYGVLNVYYLDIDTPGGGLQNANLRAKTYEPQVGESITVEVRAGQHGPLLKRVTDFDGNRPASGAPSSNGPRPRRDSDPQRSGRIERQHSQEMALRYLIAKGIELDTDLDALDKVRQVTDWFQDDLENWDRSTGVPSPPVPPSQGAHEGTDSAPPLTDTAESVQADKTLLSDDGEGLPF